MDILLVNPYTLSQDPNERRFGKPFPPLGILYIAAYLRERGFDVGYMDETFRAGGGGPIPGDVKEGWVGFYTTSVARRNAMALIRKAKSNGGKVMVGGPDASMDPDPYLRAGADVAVVGEGEATAEEVLKGWDPEGKEIPGTAYLRDGEVHQTPPRSLLEDLDSLPLPARELAPMEDYMGMWKRRHGISMVNMISSRGCPYGCKWCCRPVYGRTFRQRSVDSVVSEVRAIKEAYDPDRIWFSDDVLPMRREWVRDLSEAMRSEGVEFECLSRVDLMDEDTARLLRKGGCRKVYLGVESGSQRVLDAMGKGTTVEQIERASRALKGSGIEQHWYLMYGYPGERTTDILATMELSQRLLPEHFGISIAYPLKGTEFYDEVKDRLVGDDWEQSMDNRLVFEREHSQRYYDAARLWTHGVVRTARHVGKGAPSRLWNKLTMLSARIVLGLIGRRG